MEPSEPASGPRSLKWPINDFVDELRELTALEFAELHRDMRRIRAARGDRPSPELVSQVVAMSGLLNLTYAYCVPIPLIRAKLHQVPRVLLDRALFAAEALELLRMEPVLVLWPFVEIEAGIPHERGLLYWIVPLTK